MYCNIYIFTTILHKHLLGIKYKYILNIAMLNDNNIKLIITIIIDISLKPIKKWDIYTNMYEGF